MPRRPRLYGRIRTTTADTLQHSHAAAFSNDQFDGRQERSLYGSDQCFPRGILFCDVGAVEDWDADRSDAENAVGDYWRRGAGDELYGAGGADEDAGV